MELPLRRGPVLAANTSPGRSRPSAGVDDNEDNEYDVIEHAIEQASSAAGLGTRV